MNTRDRNFVLRPNKHVLYSVSMSSKRSKKTDHRENELDALDATRSPQEDGQIDSQESDDLEEEFSLDQLSQAYAEVLRKRDGGDGGKGESPGAQVTTEVELSLIHI